MKINSIYLERFRNEGHYDFYVEFKALIDKYPGVRKLVSAGCKALEELHDKEALLVDANRKSNYTKPLFDTDNRIDRTVTGLNESIRAALHHFKPEMAAAAERLASRMKNFGDIVHKAYHEENAAVRLLVSELRGDYAPQVAQLNLTEWVDELAAAQSLFDELFADRNVEQSHKPTENTIAVRKKIDAQYREITADLNAHSRINNQQDLLDFIAELNTIVDYFNQHNRHHKKIDHTK